jgi:nitrogen fixation/metabolism regulation signal transduction histidine kinase
MGFNRRFEVGLLWRTALLFALLALFGWTLFHTGLGATRLLVAAAAAGTLFALWNHVRQTNLAVARFVEAVRYEDFSQRFSLGGGGGFDTLGVALDEALTALAERRSGAGEEARFLSAVIDDTPVALLSIDAGGQVALLNKAARQLLDRHQGVRLTDFEAYGPEFAAALRQPPARRRLTRIVIDGVAHRAIIGSGRVERLSGELKIVSVMPIQQVLGAAEMAAQGDLVRVLSHEIMNSLTPVTSLARTAAALMEADGDEEDPARRDAREAVETLARRAEGISRFVESYRAFAQTPEVRARRFDVAEWAGQIVRLCEADPKLGSVTIRTEIDDEPTLDADPDLLAQVIINLIRNAAAAASAHRSDPEVRLCIEKTRRGRTTILVSDNGPGIPKERVNDIFLPFYTTKRDGSGVGLSFARQVIVAHGGVIEAEQAPEGGAQFRILI